MKISKSYIDVEIKYSQYKSEINTNIIFSMQVYSLKFAVKLLLAS